ncbi:hypothetical protein [Agarivorans sp. Alg241-V36]|uniref:hypothetical protein n=1 Tax=Agarivorans sp. Alg241-V36 TaxID=2305992 RepID=UPI0013D061C4|nr:hypothetical protein [Agarivorans sp. Alg241-V36]
MRLLLLLSLSLSSSLCFAFNSYKIHSTPSEQITPNAQVNYLFHQTSKGPIKVRIEGLVGLVDNYATLKLNCAANGEVNVHHNLMNNNNAILDDQQHLPTFGLPLSPQQTNQLKNQDHIRLIQATTTLANHNITRSTISLQGFRQTYLRVNELCLEQKNVSVNTNL